MPTINIIIGLIAIVALGIVIRFFTAYVTAKAGGNRKQRRERAKALKDQADWLSSHHQIIWAHSPGHLRSSLDGWPDAASANTNNCMDTNFLAWDLVRVIMLCGAGTAAGYLPEEEALDTAWVASHGLQESYASQNSPPAPMRGAKAVPFTIVRQDITQMNVDAIVNATNTRIQMDGGVCGAIFQAAGAQRRTTPDYRAQHVMFVIMTDGCEKLEPGEQAPPLVLDDDGSTRPPTTLVDLWLG